MRENPKQPGLWSEFVRLTGFALDEAQLAQLAGMLPELGDSADLPTRYSLALLGDGTLSMLGPAIAASALRRDLRIETLCGEYGSAMSEAMDADSAIHRANPDFALLCFDHRSLGLSNLQTSEEEGRARVRDALTKIRLIVEQLRGSVRRSILLQTVPPPTDSLFGSFDIASPTSPYAQVCALNAELADWASRDDIVLVDAARLAATVGLEAWHDPQQWNASKLPFAFSMLPIYGEFVARTLGAILGKSKKCLVLDLDNTLWGGVIGDDGIEGIALGQGSATGEAFIAVQQMALDLRRRGVVLAVCSKNEEDAALLPFHGHSEMLLKRDHIAVFKANWRDKAANLQEIAASLNIGLDALVFLDDNPAEREQVRRELPTVGVPELPLNPALFPRTLAAAGYFDAISFGEEDRARADNYQANSARSSLQASSSNIGEYLKSLEMVCTIRPFTPEGRSRISQLINKSNQFNLTTRRYTEQEVASVESDPGRYGIQIMLTDRFGNNGMISVLIAEKGEQAWTIDTWLMSCRVLGRKVEEAALADLVQAARKAGADRLIGNYIPSPKNRMVADHYRKLGFSQIGESAGAGSAWELVLNGYQPPDLPMRVVREVTEGSQIE